MRTHFFCPRWGSEEMKITRFLTQAKSAGYDGAEVAISRDFNKRSLDELFDAAAKVGMRIIAQHYDTYEFDYAQHYDVFSAWLERMKPYKPLKIDSQTGKDFFSFSENCSLIALASAFTETTGITVCHETHRNKALFAAHVAREFLLRVPDFRITLDASHWVCVAESLLQDQSEALHLAIARTSHIHARVGYPEGPQVPDPRMPEYEEALDAHLRWWDLVAEHFEANGEILTITPEFGPFPYMVLNPKSRVEIADQWDLNFYMMNLLKDRYA